MARYTFEDCRRGALEDLGDAADWLRYIDAPATAEQRAALRDALRLIGEAKTKLDEAVSFSAPKGVELAVTAAGSLADQP